MDELEPASKLARGSWGPGLIGLTISAMLYGVTIGQVIFYWSSFPRDLRMIKLVVFTVFIAATIHIIVACQFSWHLLVACHRSHTPECTTQSPWGIYPVLVVHFVTTYAVQCFYCHRVWIISGRNKRITSAIFITATTPLVLGLMYTSQVFKNGTLKHLYSRPLSAYAAGSSTICDILITCAIAYYLWLRQPRFRSHGKILQDLLAVFINTGVLTCLVCLAMVVVYLVQGDNYWTGAAAPVIVPCYVNSLLAVLNARKSIRDRQQHRIQVPTLSTIYD